MVPLEEIKRMIKIEIFKARYSKDELINMIYISIVQIEFIIVIKINMNGMVLCYYTVDMTYEMNAIQHCSSQ